VMRSSNLYPTTHFLRAYIERSPQRSMRGTSNNLTCFDCRECEDTQGTEQGFCKEQDSPIGGLGWNIENFDKFFAHIDPRFARYCGAFKLRYPFAVRGIKVTVYVTTVERLREVFHNLLGGTSK